ncbi:hypothetical protein V2J09_018468 [Rumex salicifolius]
MEEEPDDPGNSQFWVARAAPTNSEKEARTEAWEVSLPKDGVLGLFEIHASGVNVERICQNLGYSENARVDAVGQSGGIWFLWKPERIKINIVMLNQQFIHVVVGEGSKTFNLFAVYACPSSLRCRHLWTKLHMQIQQLRRPIFIGGDFNCKMRLNERDGGSGLLSPDSMDFIAWANGLQWIDLGFSGPRVAKRLGRLFTCPLGRVFWSEAQMTHLEAVSSDHSEWLLDIPTTEALAKLREKLISWNKEYDLHQELEKTLEEEELLWFQKARDKWVQFGDRNTRYFHTSTLIRRRRNKVEALMNDEGTWVTDQSELEGMVRGFYNSLYSRDSLVDLPLHHTLLAEGFPALGEGDIGCPRRPFTEQDVYEAVCAMSPYKAPGSDGFHAGFFQNVGTKWGNHLCNVLLKIITKTLAMRLKGLMLKLVGPAQESFIKGRAISDNILVAQEIVYAMRRIHVKKGLMLLKLDLEKAYDRVR